MFAAAKKKNTAHLLFRHPSIHPATRKIIILKITDFKNLM